MTFTRMRVDVRRSTRLDPRLVAVLERMTEPDPERRLSDARVALEQLRPLTTRYGSGQGPALRALAQQAAAGPTHRGVPDEDLLPSERMREAGARLATLDAPMDVPPLSQAVGGVEGGAISPDGTVIVVDHHVIDTHRMAPIATLPDGLHPVAVSVAGAVPQGYIDGVTAQRACRAAGKRLCTDAEWLRACQGAAGQTFPYGAARQDGVCNDARAQHPAVQLFPDDPNPFDRIQHPCINQLADGLATTGEHAGCVSADGAFDMMGNLHEWTADPEGTFRGGFYVDTVRNGPGCRYRTGAHGRGHWDYSTGFRCCADR